VHHHKIASPSKNWLLSLAHRAVEELAALSLAAPSKNWLLPRSPCR
jgi:hypothetical protein